MATTHVEREDKYDVASTFRMPDGLGLADGGTVHHEATYYDTAAHDLLRQRITLRRRTGGADAGWHLKVPHGTARLELRLPLGAGEDTVPQRLRELVAGVSLGAGLVPAAVLRTERRLGLLRDGERVLAEVADDTVHAVATGAAARASEWREVEVELVDGDERVLRRVGKALRAAGATPSASRSKVARAIGETAPPGGDGADPARGAVGAYLAEQYSALLAGDVGLRRGRNAVHKTRVAARRLRSVLRVFGPVLDAGRVAPVEAELSWYQDLLGEVRDAQVQRSYLTSAVAELPAELVLGPVVADIESTLNGAEARALDEVRTALVGERYLALLRGVRELVDDPPVRPGTTLADLRRRAEKARRTSARRLRTGAHGDDAALHRARKAAKRSRYAAELVAAAGGPGAKGARRSVKAHRRVQDVLGEHQDSVVAGRHLRALGAAGADAGRNGFTLGLLWAREQDRRAGLRRAASAARL